MRPPSPLRLFRVVAVVEATTWALLLVGMALKYLTETTELGVQVAGPVHGVAFVAYCLVAVLVAIDARWSVGRTLLALLAAVPPFLTVPFDLVAERRGWLSADWRLRAQTPTSLLERPTAWLLRHPGRGALTGVAAVAVLTGVALLAGPPV